MGASHAVGKSFTIFTIFTIAVGKSSACNAGDLGSIPGLGRSHGEGNGNPLQYSCLENDMDRGAWQATVHRVARVRHDLVTKPPLPEARIGMNLQRRVRHSEWKAHCVINELREKRKQCSRSVV